jgi:aspartyl-tRNA synthetase
MMCGEPRVEHVGRRLTLSGWVDTRRDHGGLVFVDLRDRGGQCQVVVNPEHDPEAAELSHQLRNEFVVRVSGELVRREPEAVNPNIATGEVELQADTLEIVSRSTPLPFQLEEENVDETLRLRYRWLDLRRPKMQRMIATRARMVGTIRRVMEDAGFLDIQTPILFKPTPEGARDFVVPSRLRSGRFFALPQSPQILKQLLVISGFDRYYQIAICFRDEDLRADRVQEITQLDVEQAFPDQEELFGLMERMVQAVWQECRGIEIEAPFERLPYAEAQLRYGSDKPDLRFGLEIQDATDATRGSEFGVFSGAECVRYLTVPGAISRGELAKLEERAKELGAKGLAYLIFDGPSGEPRSPIAKFLSEAEVEAVRPDEPATVLFGADAPGAVARALGQLRLELGESLELVDKDSFRFVWVTDFPLLEWDDDAERWSAMHHPFTRPTTETEALLESSPGEALAHAYDLVVNGIEIGGGSFRIHEPELQERVFDALRLTSEEQRVKFGFLLDALAMGAPPHGGIAFGIERMMMALEGEPNLRDVIAFPKNQAGVDPMSGAPAPVDDVQLRELGIDLRPDVAAALAAELEEPE